MWDWKRSCDRTEYVGDVAFGTRTHSAKFESDSTDSPTFKAPRHDGDADARNQTETARNREQNGE